MSLISNLQNLYWPALLLATTSTYALGAIWYSPLLLGKAWQKANGFTPEYLKSRNMSLVSGISYLISFFMALGLALFIGEQGLTYGMTAGFVTGFCLSTMPVAMLALVEKRPPSYVLINGGYFIVAFTAMGAILGGWK